MFPALPVRRLAKTRIGFFGFSEFERAALDSYFRLLSGVGKTYVLADLIEDCDLIVASSDSAETFNLVGRSGRIPDTLFVGQRPVPATAAGNLPRPIDARRVRQALDEIRQARVHHPHPSMHVRQMGLECAEVQDFRTSSGFSNSVLIEPEAALAPVVVMSRSVSHQHQLRAMLRHCGYGVTVTHSPQEMVTASSACRPAFVFVDLGPEPALALGAVRDVRQAAPAGKSPVVVALSTDGRTTTRLRAMFAGCEALLPLPLESDDLQNLLTRHDPTFERVFEATAVMSL